MKPTFLDIYRLQRRQVRRFLRMDEDGGTNTIEFVLWLPIFILILALVVDVCFLFLAQAVTFDVASDTARRRAVNFFTTDAAASNFLATEATFNNTAPVVATVTTSGVEVTARVEFAPGDLDLIGVLGFISSDRMSVQVLQLKEGI
ncbi:pilus assembly protein [Halovulum dunhuangense]|uniref:Pilus assembly protein n=1 Tax=Halovulum dunhuangense TaxID=1505036 RepID=A0A849KZI1_9RHOB|nr:TadE/TadG family type IV pilus assembly protein [Halovulum dunhuangense]NNU79124.1 pilus assembly protein [Halovulum dunhuangense]